jgi:predicted dehydrogenase
MLTHFIEALRNGTPSECDAKVGWNALAVIEAAATSVQTGRKCTVKTRA